MLARSFAPRAAMAALRRSLPPASRLALYRILSSSASSGRRGGLRAAAAAPHAAVPVKPAPTPPTTIVAPRHAPPPQTASPALPPPPPPPPPPQGLATRLWRWARLFIPSVVVYGTVHADLPLPPPPLGHTSAPLAKCGIVRIFCVSIVDPFVLPSLHRQVSPLAPSLPTWTTATCFRYPAGHIET